MFSRVFAAGIRLLSGGSAWAGEAGHEGHDGSALQSATGMPQSEGFFEFFARIFRSDFMPHGHCYFWRPEIVWLHVLSDALIALSYFAIPVMLVYFIRRRRDIPFHFMFLMFGAFIFLCGTTHVLGVVTLWTPVYRLDGVVKALTALVSLCTAAALFPMIPKALTLRSPKQLEKINKELAEAYKKIKETEKQKDEFFARVSHELRTPLTLILAPVESLISQGGFSSEQKTLLKSMHNNSIRLLQMVTGLLDISKIEAGKIEVQRTLLPLEPVTRGMLEDFRGIVDSRKIRLDFSCDPSDVWVELDRYLYERILFNLLTNAIKFTPEGGWVEVSVRAAGSELELVVRDSGIGIAAEDLPLLFQRFSQLQGSGTTRRSDGSGLGLSLVREFAQTMGGDVGVTSAPGKGTAFRVTVKAKVTDPGGDAVSGATAAEHRKGPVLQPVGETLEFSVSDVLVEERAKILVAEDNRELGDYIASLLSPLGEVRIAASGEEALEQVVAWRPDLVLSDVMMSGIDGIALCREIKSLPTPSAIPAVVLLTAQTQRDALLHGWEAGADEYLFKPFHPVELMVRLKSILALTRQKRRAVDAKRRIEELEHFTYFASHDLREPLRNMVVYAQMLQRTQKSASVDDSTREYLSYIVDAANRMRELIESLVQYSTVNTEHPEFEMVDCNSVLEEVKSNLTTAIAEAGATILAANLPVISANRAYLVQLFQNLVGNALKFKGSVSPEIQISALVAHDEWVISVRDNGIGLKMEYADKIFVIFKRLHGRSEYSGTGIGLAICKRIVDRLGGRIWVESVEGKGATFHFTVPVSR